MGLLTEGSPLSWEETKKHAQHVREHGITQFINLYKKLRDREGDILKWGDEVEYIIVKFFDDKKEAKVSLRSHELLTILNQKEQDDPNGVKSLWRPEFGAYMIEGTPGHPYGGLLAHFNIVEANMKHRRQEVMELLQPNETIMSITSFPRLGCENFTDPSTKATPDKGATRSLFFPDEAIYPGHPRFENLVRNIRMRRGEKVAINLPIYKDINTKIPVDDSSKHSNAALEDHVYLDAMGFGMGCCCLQLTFQACNITEARTLYDQLTPLCPIMLAFTAASPLHRGFITDIDCRWNIIAGSVDCRTEEERGLKPLKENKFVIKKSRYDSIDSYLSPQGEKYNDIPLLYNEEDYKKLIDNGIDPLLAGHIAHLFIRDTVSLFSEKVHQNDEEDSDHFENIQSTNWQTMRFKPPPPQSTIGWRVEFRPCEAQITDFENAAIVCFVVLLTRVILSYQLNFLIPISKVDENMQNAQKRNAARDQKFWFRRDITTHVSPPAANECCKGTTKDCDMFVQMTINEIINGKGEEFPGLIPLINNYLSGMDVDADTHCTIQQYLKFIQRRASGEILTTASWIRKFVTEHPEYRYDSVVSERINYDLLKTIEEIQSGKKYCPLLLGTSTMSKTKENIPTALRNDC
ncbi:glutamate--cysteine ligase [Diabrotica virgifera virgifera]|uniref:Glutamate--cysteine ligase n=1 Tax=Diabrotica virgifera virgifera TaxID=50390 RepID=A0A6P7FB19_DIAVI|nr:glutamate--cysteine ligase [Diabrotica virgifera virgifera]